jgi:hypothetical protein
MVALLCFLLRLLASSFKSTSRLEAENAALRQQLTVLQRKVRGRVQLTNGDRLFFIQMYRWFPAILKAMTIIRPETLVRWHRAGFRRYWRWKSRNLGGRPRIDAGLRALIRRMSVPALVVVDHAVSQLSACRIGEKRLLAVLSPLLTGVVIRCFGWKKAGKADRTAIRDALRHVADVPNRWRMASIASDDALILPHRANPHGWNFRERQDEVFGTHRSTLPNANRFGDLRRSTLS